MPEPYDQNPFAGADPDRMNLWRVLVYDDIEAFLDCDWDRHAVDFEPECFFGIDAGKSADPDDWKLAFPTLDVYRENWLGFARNSATRANREALRRAHFEASRLDRIEISGDRAVCHKLFDGQVRFDDGTVDELNWRTIYFCRKSVDKWRITSFIGFMKNG